MLDVVVDIARKCGAANKQPEIAREPKNSFHMDCERPIRKTQITPNKTLLSERRIGGC